MYALYGPKLQPYYSKVQALLTVTTTVSFLLMTCLDEHVITIDHQDLWYNALIRTTAVLVGVIMVLGQPHWIRCCICCLTYRSNSNRQDWLTVYHPWLNLSPSRPSSSSSTRRSPTLLLAVSVVASLGLVAQGGIIGLVFARSEPLLSHFTYTIVQLLAIQFRVMCINIIVSQRKAYIKELYPDIIDF